MTRGALLRQSSHLWCGIVQVWSENAKLIWPRVADSFRLHFGSSLRFMVGGWEAVKGSQ